MATLDLSPDIGPPEGGSVFTREIEFGVRTLGDSILDGAQGTTFAALAMLETAGFPPVAVEGSWVQTRLVAVRLPQQRKYWGKNSFRLYTLACRWAKDKRFNPAHPQHIAALVRAEPFLRWGLKISGSKKLVLIATRSVTVAGARYWMTIQYPEDEGDPRAYRTAVEGTNLPPETFFCFVSEIPGAAG